MSSITSEGFSFHTFELTRSIDSGQYRTIKDALYNSAKRNKCRVYPDNNCLVSEQFKRFGIIAKLYKNGSFDLLQLRINPRLTCGDYNYLGIFIYSEENITTVFNTIDRVLNTIHSGFQMEDMNLSRIDLCVNLELEDRNITETYLRCIQKCAIPKKFRRDRFSPTERNYEKKNKFSFRAVSPELTFTAYDKIFQAKEENLLNQFEQAPSALIRFEVSLGRTIIHQLSVQSLKTAACIPKLFQYFGCNSRSIMKNVISTFFPAGQYVTYEEAKREIVIARLKRKIRKRMLSLLGHASLCNNLNNAIRELREEYGLTDYQVRVILKAFEELQINPVTLAMQERPYLRIEGVRELLGFELS